MLRFFAKIWLKWLIWRHTGISQNALDPSSIKSLLFIELTRFGDVVTMLPVIRSFHDAFPDATITVAVQAPYAGLLRYLPFSVGVIALKKTDSLWGFFRSVAVIRTIQSDLAVSMSPGIRNAALTLNTSAYAKIGYVDSRDTVTPFLHRYDVRGFGIEMKNESYSGENITLRANKICLALGITPHDKVPLRIPPAAIASAKKSTGSNGNPIVLLHPFAGWSYREWKHSNFTALAEKLAAGNPVNIIFLGTEREIARLRQRTSIPAGCTVVNPQHMDELMGLMGIASLYIGGDSGPLHLASMVGVPCVGLYGPASPELTAPVSAVNTYLYHKVDCSPCDQRRCIRPENPCINLIGIYNVLDAANALLRTPVPAA